MDNRNVFLASLSNDHFEFLRPRMRTIDLVQGATVMHADTKLDRIYFPHSGVISLVTELSSGHAIENALVGLDSLVGGGMAIASGNIALCTGIVQMAGIASVIPLDDLRALAKSDGDVYDAVLRHEQCLQLQAQQAVACNAVHNLDARLASWLLRFHDLVPDDKVSLTQELIAEMLGVRRTSVTIAAARLQDAAFVDYRRGHIYIRDRDGLRAAACECYETLRLRTSQRLGLEPRAKQPTKS
jgi:CRP-like cAMP-binding protein